MSFWEIIRWPFGQLIRIIYEWFGSYAIALLLFAIAIKLVLLPFSIKQQKNQIKAAKLRPKMVAIEKKYAGRTDRKTMEKKQQEMMALQQSEGYSPLSGCLPMLIQMPIIIILYQVIQRPLTYICQFGTDTLNALRDGVNAIIGGANPLGMEALTEKSLEFEILRDAQQLIESGHLTSGGAITPDMISTVEGTRLSLFGIMDLTATPALDSLLNFGLPTLLLLIPILTFAASFFSMKLSRKFMVNPMGTEMTPDMKKSNMIMDFMMPAMSLFIAFSVPAGVGLYWIYQSLLGMGQQFALSKLMPLPTYTPEEIRAMQKAEKERQAAAVAAAKQRRALAEYNDDDEEDIDIPVIRSKFDNEDAFPAPKAQAPKSNKNKKK